MSNKIPTHLQSPDSKKIPAVEDIQAAYISAVQQIPQSLDSINNALCDLANYMQVLTICVKKQTQDKGLLAPDEINSMDELISFEQDDEHESV